jgi:hypothetical protein
MDRTDYVGSSTSHNPTGLHGLLQKWLYFNYYHRNAIKIMSEIRNTHLARMTNVSEIVKSLLQNSLVTIPAPMDVQEAIHLHHPT